MNTDINDNSIIAETAEANLPTPDHAESPLSISRFGLSKMDILGMWVLMLVTGATMLTAYHYKFANKKTGVAVVDVAEVVTIQQEQFVELLSSANVTDKDREQSFLMVSSFGERMKAAIGEIQEECGCTLVVKSAVIGTVADYTDSLKAKMGMTGMSAAASNPVKENSTGAVQEDFLKGVRGLGK